jgi:hypothetical protein
MIRNPSRDLKILQGWIAYQNGQTSRRPASGLPFSTLLRDVVQVGDPATYRLGFQLQICTGACMQMLGDSQYRGRSGNHTFRRIGNCTRTLS